jgi:pyruvate kinase
MKTTPKKTKIVATIGPASHDISILKKMIRAGMNVARLNFSHGTHDSHKESLDRIKIASTATKTPVAILQDLSGPKIRIGTFANGSVILKRGQRFTLTTDKIVGDNTRVHINYAKLPDEISVGAHIMIFDGKITLRVEKYTKTDIQCNVITGGLISNNKGVNIPGAQLSMRSLTKKDRADVIFGMKHNVAFIALSFVRTAADIHDLRKILQRNKSDAMIIAKIETLEAIENITEIIEATDGVMVARGDLAVEIGPEHVPLAQKRIIYHCNQLGKPVITATQMLDSMETSSVPTRAEVSDVANAILDGTDAVMLSGETATGSYPVESICVMTRIAQTTEPNNINVDLEYIGEPKNTDDAVTSSVVRVANNVRAKAIIALTSSGLTARLISRFKPYHTVYAITTSTIRQQQLLASSGVEPLIMKTSNNVNIFTKEITKFVQKQGIAKSGDTIVLSAGMPFGEVGSTNMLFVLRVE